MKIGIDASRYTIQNATGVELYSVKIIQGLINYFKKHKEYNVTLYTPRKLMLYKTKQIKHKVMRFPRLWTKVRLSIEMLLHKPDILFVPSHVFPHFTPKKAVITIHDVAFKHSKKAYSKFQWWYLNKTTKYAIKKASDIIVPSEATKKELMHYFSCSEEKIHVIHHGCDFRAKNLHIDLEDKVLKKFGLKKTEHYYLFVGRLETKKNLSRLMKAFAQLSPHFPTWKLLLCGKRGHGFDKIIKTFNEINEKDPETAKKILMSGYITENEKHVLFKFCDAFTLPSIDEGFGFPVLEAFGYKKLIIATEKGSIKEVGGEAVIYIDPYRIETIKDAMHKVILGKYNKEHIK
jgi:glycosyltransferase involved in cell wall biosynthesis